MVFAMSVVSGIFVHNQEGKLPGEPEIKYKHPVVLKASFPTALTAWWWLEQASRNFETNLRTHSAAVQLILEQ